jgi:hypothetical protein
MLPVTNFLWVHLPKLRFMQFPWRFLLCLGVPFALLIAISTKDATGIKKWPTRIALYIAMLCVIAFAWHHFQPPWWDHAPDLREMQDFISSGTGYEGTDEYTPVGADPSSGDKDARRITVIGPAHAAIRVLEWTPEHKLFTVEMSAPDTVELHLFNYPAWLAQVNGHPVSTQTRPDMGQMLVPVEAGTNRVQIDFIRTWDRTAGAWISLVALMILLLLAKLNQQKPNADRLNPLTPIHRK